MASAAPAATGAGDPAHPAGASAEGCAVGTRRGLVAAGNAAPNSGAVLEALACNMEAACAADAGKGRGCIVTAGTGATWQSMVCFQRMCSHTEACPTSAHRLHLAVQG